MTVLDRPLATAALPEPFVRWFASRGWSPRAHQLELLAKARGRRSVLLIAPTGAGKTLAGFLPSLVELSTTSPRARDVPLPPRSGGEGLGVGGDSIQISARPPTPDPSPPFAARTGGGEPHRDSQLVRQLPPSLRVASSPPAGTSAVRAGCTHSIFRRSRRWRSISRVTSSGRWPRWRCRSASRPAPATRQPANASASAVTRRTSC